MKLFETQKEKHLKNHLHDLAVIAKADGRFTKSEKQLLYQTGRKHGLTDQEIRKAISGNKAIGIKYEASESEKFDYLYELVNMMVKDGDVDGREMDYCLAMANQLGFRPAIVGVLTRQISTGLKNGESKETIKAKAQSYL